MKSSRHLVSPFLRGEVPTTTGSAIHSIVDSACGVISIGPFACLPSRMVESLLKPNMNLEHKEKEDGVTPITTELKKQGVTNLPFLPIESDGNPFTQVVQAQFEVFCLQAKRMHERMQLAKERAKKNMAN